MVEKQPPYLDLDIWLSRRPDGLGYEAHTVVEPHFLVQAEGLRLLERRCERELALHATTSGHDVTFVVRASLRPSRAGADPDAPRSKATGSRCIGRLAVVDVVSSDGASTLPRADWAA